MKTMTGFYKMIFIFAATVGLLSAVAKTASADEWNDHEKKAHDWHKRHMHHHDGPQVIEERSNIVYAPPVIVEPPPAPEDDNNSSGSGFNLVIPINIH